MPPTPKPGEPNACGLPDRQGMDSHDQRPKPIPHRSGNHSIPPTRHEPQNRPRGGHWLMRKPSVYRLTGSCQMPEGQIRKIPSKPALLRPYVERNTSSRSTAPKNPHRNETIISAAESPATHRKFPAYDHGLGNPATATRSKPIEPQQCRTVNSKDRRLATPAVPPHQPRPRAKDPFTLPPTPTPPRRAVSLALCGGQSSLSASPCGV